jgi:hypothetical protein
LIDGLDDREYGGGVVDDHVAEGLVEGKKVKEC